VNLDLSEVDAFGMTGHFYEEGGRSGDSQVRPRIRKNDVANRRFFPITTYLKLSFRINPPDSITYSRSGKVD